MADTGVWRKTLLMGAALCLLLTGCGTGGGTGSGEEGLTVLTIGTADSGGTMYHRGQRPCPGYYQRRQLHQSEYRSIHRLGDERAGLGWGRNRSGAGIR